MKKENDEIIYDITVRKKIHTVYVKLSSGPMTTIKFMYNGVCLDRQVFLPSDVDEHDTVRILEEAVKKGISEYNKRRAHKEKMNEIRGN